MNKINLYIIVLVLFSSCQEEVFLDLKQEESIPVIEAVWTTNGSLNQIIITSSKNYYDTTQMDVIGDAEVFIQNETTGDRIEFRFVPNPGYYLPVNNRIAQVGQNYLLEVRIGDNMYQSRGTTLEPPVLDSVTYRFREERLFQEEGYYVTLYGKIPFERDNYYRVKITRNDTLLNRRNDYLLFDDTFGTSILDNGFELGDFAFKDGDRVRLDLFRLNRGAYDYLTELVSLLYSDGGLFSPPPQNPPSNIQVVKGEGKVLGYFMTSPVLSTNLMITGEKD